MKIQRIGYKKEIYEMPNLLTVQLESYKNFLQEDVPPDKRTDESLHGLLKEIFPIVDLQGRYILEYLGYRVEKPRYTIEECLQKNLTYSAPIFVKIRLKKIRPQTNVIESEIEQEIYFADIPYMTPKGTFIINGVERVVLSQIHRAPGVYFIIQEKETEAYTALLVPYRGPWITFTIDGSKLISMTVSKRRKIPITRFLRILGYEDYKSMIENFLQVEEMSIDDERLLKGNYILADDVVSHETGELIFQLITEKGEFIRKDITEKFIEELKKEGVKKIKVLNTQDPAVEAMITTFRQDRIKDTRSSLTNIYRVLKYTQPKSLQDAKEYIDNFFFSGEKLFLGEVGRFKVNLRLRHEEKGFKSPSYDTYQLTKEDFIVLIKRLLDLYRGEEPEDDVDDISNRRVRRVGERLYEHIRNSLIRASKAIKEKLLTEMEDVTPKKLFNPKLITASITNFFTTDTLSQFLDQTNPLSELTHKRRISALGKGGLSRENAGIEVRDVHPSHYGRICPIETPEGQNVGLVLSLTTYAKIDDFGFIRTPLRKVKNGVLTDEIVYVAPYEEIDYKIAGGDTKVVNGKIEEKRVLVRHRRTYKIASPREVNFIDVSPRQLVSPSSSLIPFLEHDDSNRALMGSNMQRQAVPLLIPEPPIVGTGMESKIAQDSGTLILAKRDGTVTYVDAYKVIVVPDEKEDDFFGIDEYKLTKFQRSNQGTIIHHTPVVKVGQKVKKGDIIAEMVAVKDGELSLGKNLLVAFVPWYGYNFEDAIVMSERVWKDDIFTSIHIDDYEVEVRDTKLGPEQITRDLPNESEETLRNLDEFGVVRIGTEVKTDDILVGKITPEGERELTPEEKLLQAIFGEKTKGYRNTSKRVPPGVRGIVINTIILTKYSNNELTQKILEERKMRAEENYRNNLNRIRERLLELLETELSDKVLKEDILDSEGNVVFKAGEKFSKSKVSNSMSLVFGDKFISDKKTVLKIKRFYEQAREFIKIIEENYKSEIDRIEKGDELPAGVIQLVKVYIAQRRRFAIGDKLAGRHGNKGVVSIIAPIEDMPFLDDGTPVDVVLNPLGVPSRMNIGQILETLLGWAGVELTKKLRKLLKEGNITEIRKFLLDIYKPHRDMEFIEFLKNAKESEILAYAQLLAEKGIRYACPVFEGLSLEEVKEQLKLAGLPEDGKVKLRDGKTGEYFDYPCTVGYMYLMKLIHMVEDKIHARSVGSYSIITQQPLGGRAHFGGQRFGEMEVWAAEAHGAAYALQELLTVKSDDVIGRTQLYKSIVRGDLPPEPSMPESFNVLVKKLRGLCIDVEVEYQKERKA
jgi:DNA-directed RNA polymerase subunit beta